MAIFGLRGWPKCDDKGPGAGTGTGAKAAVSRCLVGAPNTTCFWGEFVGGGKIILGIFNPCLDFSGPHLSEKEWGHFHKGREEGRKERKRKEKKEMGRGICPWKEDLHTSTTYFQANFFLSFISSFYPYPSCPGPQILTIATYEHNIVLI